MQSDSPVSAPPAGPLPAAPGTGVLSPHVLRFLSSFSEDIRVPVTGILGMTDLLLETQLSPEQREYLVAARVCARQLIEKLATAVDFAHVSLHGVCARPGPFDLVEVLEAAAADQARKAALNRVELFLLPNRSLPAIVEGSMSSLLQALRCLFTHAFSYLHGCDLQLSTNFLPGSAGLLLSILMRDSGSPLPPSELDRWHEALARGVPACGSTVLPLLTAHHLAAGMGGKLEISGDPERGLLRTMTVPLGIPFDAQECQPESWNTSLHGKRALVWSGHAGVRDSVTTLLTQFGLLVSEPWSEPPSAQSPPWLLIADSDHASLPPNAWESAPHAVALGWQPPAGAPAGVVFLPKPLGRTILYDLLLLFLARDAGRR